MKKTDAAWIEKLIAGAAALRVPLDSADAQKLARFADLLIQWGAKMDLSSIEGLDEIREKHFLDSLAGLRVIERDGTLADLGSGGGFPGLALAIVRPGLRVLSVESRSKKGVFQRQVARELGLTNFDARTARIEDVVAAEKAPDWVTARALADLPALLDLSGAWLTAGSTLVAWKSSKVAEELATAPLASRHLVFERDDFALPESSAPRTLLSVRTSRS